MQDNSTNDIMETLIRYMDGELNAIEQTATENRLQQDGALQERYQHLLAAKRAIRSQGLRQQVQSIQQEYLKESKAEEKPAARQIKQSSFLKMAMSVAAVLLLVVAGIGLFEYTTTNRQSLYNDAYIAYQLPVSRGSEKPGNLDALYASQNYSGVIESFNRKAEKDQKNYFLAGQSYLHLNDATHAITAFQNVEAINSKSTEKYFAQETDYYLALAYLNANQIEAAEKQLDKIVSDKNHLFYNRAKGISRTRLQILKWKEK